MLGRELRGCAARLNLEEGEVRIPTLRNPKGNSATWHKLEEGGRERNTSKLEECLLIWGFLVVWCGTVCQDGKDL